MVTRQDREDSTAVFHITIQKDELKPKIDSELKNIRQRAPIDGFRKGHIPASIVKKRYGSSIFADLFQKTISDKLTAYLKEEQIPIFGFPLMADDNVWPAFNVDQIDDSYTVSYEAILSPRNLEIAGLDGTQTYKRWVANDLSVRSEEIVAEAMKNAKGQVEAEGDMEIRDIVTIEARELTSEGGVVREEGHHVEIKVMPETVKDKAVRAELMSKKKGDTFHFNARTLEALNEQQYRKYILQLAADDNKEVGDYFEGTLLSVKRLQEGVADEDFFKRSFGPDVMDQEGAVLSVERELKSVYRRYADFLLYQEVRKGLLENNPIPLSERLLKRILKLSDAKIPAERLDQQYEAVRNELRWDFIEENLRTRFNLKVAEDELLDAIIEDAERNIGMKLSRQFWEGMADRLLKDEKRVEDAARRLMFYKIMHTALFPNILTEEVPVSGKELEALYENQFAKSKPDTSEELATAEELAAEA